MLRNRSASDVYQTRALMLFLRLNQQAVLYTPLSHRGRRAHRLMQRLAVRLQVTPCL